MSLFEKVLSSPKITAALLLGAFLVLTALMWIDVLPWISMAFSGVIIVLAMFLLIWFLDNSAFKNR